MKSIAHRYYRVRLLSNRITLLRDCDLALGSSVSAQIRNLSPDCRLKVFKYPVEMAMRNMLKVLVWVTLLIGIILVSLLGVFLLGIRQKRAIRSVNGLCRADSFLLYQAFFVPMQQVSAVDSAFSVALGNLSPGADETEVADLVNNTVQIADPVVGAVW